MQTSKESELVSGFMTEHAAVVFVFFFLAEYGSIVLMCILSSILFLGGYLLINNIDIYNFLFIDILNFNNFFSETDNLFFFDAQAINYFNLSL
jgi:NADH-ubiquinone oxidoreductase chain 1